jgi:hypothetical protein
MRSHILGTVGGAKRLGESSRSEFGKRCGISSHTPSDLEQL